ncbi:MAG TPA: hypothetical protein VK658_00745 [Chryseolinea sp.]|nr:hypothetical protein [Chryseolinea sp.]
MKTKPDVANLIHDYFDGNLDESQKKELMQFLEENTEAREEFETVRLAVASIKASGLRQMLEGFQRENYPEDAAAAERRRALRGTSREDASSTDTNQGK